MGPYWEDAWVACNMGKRPYGRTVNFMCQRPIFASRIPRGYSSGYSCPASGSTHCYGRDRVERSFGSGRYSVGPA